MRPACRFLSVAALALATSACATAPPSASVGATGSPTPPPIATPTVAPTIGPSIPPSTLPPAETPAPTPTVEPTQPPTPSPTPSVPSSPNPTAGAIDHPTDANVVILRVEQVGGFINPASVFARIPAFSLFGDGTVIYTPANGGVLQGTALPPVPTAHMDEDQVQALLRFALGRGRLLDARPEYVNPRIADAPSTVFTLNAGDASKKVTIQALTDDPEPGPDQADLAGFGVLRALLSDFGQQVAAGQATPGLSYAPAGYLVQLFPAGDPVPGSTPWPWPEIKQTDLTGGPDQNGFFTVTITADQLAKLTLVPSGGLMGVPVVGPDGKAYELSARPMLPDDNATGGPVATPAG